MWTIIITATIVLLIVLGIFISKDTKKQAKKAKELIKAFDKKYADYINAKVNYSIIKNNDEKIDKELMKNEVMIILKPDISGLISFINSSDYSSVSVNYKSSYFNNVVSLTEELFNKKGKNKNDLLSDEDEKDLFTAFEDAIISDLTNRILNIETSML